MKPLMIFLSCEHAVNTIPPAYHYLFKEQEALLQSHRAIDFGAKEMTLLLSESLDCKYRLAEASRLLIDCNRSLHHPHCFSEFTKKLAKAEKLNIIAQYYLPYRQQVETQIGAHIHDGYQIFHISIHSFTPVFNNVTRNACIGLLYDPKRHGEKEVAREWGRLLSKQTNYRVRMNYPYQGKNDGFTTLLRTKHAEKDYVGIELELNQAVIKDKDSFNALGLALSESLKELLQLL